jgi:hypothetical protein
VDPGDEERVAGYYAICPAVVVRDVVIAVNDVGVPMQPVA